MHTHIHAYPLLQLTDGEVRARETVLRDLEDAVRSKWPEAQLQTFGSYPSGLSAFNGDLDLSVMLPHHTDRAGQMPAGSSSSSSSRLLTGGEDGEEGSGADADADGDADGDGDTDGDLVIEFDRTGDPSVGASDADIPPTPSPSTPGGRAGSEGGDSEGGGARGEAGRGVKRGRPGVVSMDDSDGDDIEVHCVGAAVQRQLLAFSGDRDRDRGRGPRRADNVLAVPAQFFHRSARQGTGGRAGAGAGADAAERGRVKLRNERLERLTALCNHLRAMGWLDVIELRKRARVPIINLTHKADIECDVGLGVDAEDTTEHVTMMKKCYGAEFIVVALFLKMLLRINDLDKPFTGGIGSYKLYVMINYVFRRVHRYYKSKQQDSSSTEAPAPDAAFLLFAFLKFYGNRNNLNRDTVIQIKASGEEEDARLASFPSASFDGAFTIDNCCSLFQSVWTMLDKSAGSGAPGGAGAGAGAGGTKRQRGAGQANAADKSHLSSLFIRGGRNLLAAARERSRLAYSYSEDGPASSGSGSGSSGSSDRDKDKDSRRVHEPLLQPWGSRSEANRVRVADSILSELQRRLEKCEGIQQQQAVAVAMAELDRAAPTLAARLRSYRSLEDAVRHLDSEAGASRAYFSGGSGGGGGAFQRFSSQPHGRVVVTSLPPRLLPPGAKKATQASAARAAMERDSPHISKKAEKMKRSAKINAKKAGKTKKTVTIVNNDMHNDLVFDGAGKKKKKAKTNGQKKKSKQQERRHETY
jgi:hypothetical protein